jgi:hypothetical protein
MSSYIFNPKDWKKTTLTDEMLDEIKILKLIISS